MHAFYCTVFALAAWSASKEAACSEINGANTVAMESSSQEIAARIASEGVSTDSKIPNGVAGVSSSSLFPSTVSQSSGASSTLSQSSSHNGQTLSTSPAVSPIFTSSLTATESVLPSSSYHMPLTTDNTPSTVALTSFASAVSVAFNSSISSVMPVSYIVNASTMASFTTSIPHSIPMNSSIVSNATTVVPYPSIVNVSSIGNYSLTSMLVSNSTNTLPVNISSTLVSPSSSFHSLVPASSHIVRNASGMTPAKKDCNVVLFGLSDAMANVSRCAILFLRPMHVCEKCAAPLQGLMKYHKVAFKECGHELIQDYNDQFQLIPKMFDFSASIWNTLDCDKCYNNRETSASPMVLSDEFRRFKHLLATTMACFRNHSNIVLPYSTVTPLNASLPANWSGSGDVCSSCEAPYLKLQEYFQSLNDESARTSQWCADIVHAINQTRFIWSKTFQCSRLKRDVESVVALTCFFCFLPIMFYVGTKLHADVKDRKHDSNDTRLHYESD